MEYDQSLTD